MPKKRLALWLVVSAALNFHIFFKPSHVKSTVVAEAKAIAVAEAKAIAVAEAKAIAVAEAKAIVVAEAVVAKAKAIVIGDHTVLHMPALPAATAPLVLLGFPFLCELDLLHIKLQLLSDVVSFFVVSESCFTQSGHPKPLHFNQSKHEPRFQAYRAQIWHITDCEPPPNTDDQLGWLQTDKVKSNIGLALLSQPQIHNASVVIVGDSDEVPSAKAVEWLVHESPLHSTYEFESSMPHYIYNFQWRVRPSGYSTMTARSAQLERLFWASRLAGTKGFQQTIQPLPSAVAEGSFHCSYCLPYDEMNEKIHSANTVDGALILGRYQWQVETLRALKGCGVTPQGTQCELRPLLNLSVFEPQYPHLFEVPPCVPFHLPFQ